MENYVTSIRDLVIHVMKDNQGIMARAEAGDAKSCFEAGMIHLLGVETPVDFKKASVYFGNQALINNVEAKMILGFIAECTGNYSQAFEIYSRIDGKEEDSYLNRVKNGRFFVHDYFKKLNLPNVLNNVISSTLNDYSKGKASTIGASIKIAAICNDELTCIEAAKLQYEAGDHISASKWLHKGNVSADHPLYTAINEKHAHLKETLKKSKDILVLDLEGHTLLSSQDLTPFLAKIKQSCDETASKCQRKWNKNVRSNIDSIINEYKEQLHQERLALIAEEEARKKRRKKIIRYIVIPLCILFFFHLVGSLGDSSSENNTSVENVSEESLLSGNKEFHGVVDKYPITMSLQIEGSTIKGTLYYNKYGPDNYLVLTGVLKKNELDIDESDVNGQLTGHFLGNYSDGVFHGVYTTHKGKSMSFKVSE